MTMDQLQTIRLVPAVVGAYPIAAAPEPLPRPATPAAAPAPAPAPGQAGPAVDDRQNKADTGERIAKLAERVAADLAGPRTRLSIKLDEGSGRFVYQAIDVETGEVKQQFPPEKLLALLAAEREANGLVLDTEV